MLLISHCRSCVDIANTNIQIFMFRLLAKSVPISIFQNQQNQFFNLDLSNVDFWSSIGMKIQMKVHDTRKSWQQLSVCFDCHKFKTNKSWNRFRLVAFDWPNFKCSLRHNLFILIKVQNHYEVYDGPKHLRWENYHNSLAYKLETKCIDKLLNCLFFSAFILRRSATTRKNDHIKRPMNGFMVYAQQARRQLSSKHPNLQNSELSKRLGELWR